jgi:DNA recombination protein RmuC
MQLLRGETDTLKTDGDERERRMVTGLATAIIERTRDFGAKIDRFVSQIDSRAEIVGKSLRPIWRNFTAKQIKIVTRCKLVDERLGDSMAKQAAIARELREELSAGFLNVGRNVSLTLEHSSELQRERLDDLKNALERTTEQQSKSQAGLRMAGESRLDAIRLESSAKLENMRLTLDEKLHVTLETRMQQSFSRIVDQLSKVYEQIGEMKFASIANGHPRFLPN